MADNEDYISNIKIFVLLAHVLVLAACGMTVDEYQLSTNFSKENLGTELSDKSQQDDSITDNMPRDQWLTYRSELVHIAKNTGWSVGVISFGTGTALNVIAHMDQQKLRRSIAQKALLERDLPVKTPEPIHFSLSPGQVKPHIYSDELAQFLAEKFDFSIDTFVKHPFRELDRVGYSWSDLLRAFLAEQTDPEKAMGLVVAPKYRARFLIFQNASHHPIPRDYTWLSGEYIDVLARTLQVDLLVFTRSQGLARKHLHLLTISQSHEWTGLTLKKAFMPHSHLVKGLYVVAGVFGALFISDTLWQQYFSVNRVLSE
ncbi:MAG: hypothetical protein OXC40_06140 [Proteobacteria bacterium]|nr:hypothetical protein [Pseudomonadota bacterium]